MIKSNEVYLILTNKLQPSVFALYQDIRGKDVEERRFYILFHHEDDVNVDVAKRPFVYSFNYESLSTLNYIALDEDLVPGSTHFPLLHFFLNNPDFDYYWFIEDDVRFTGEWRMLFSSFNSDRSDFISSHLRHSKEEPGWVWWDALWHPDETIPIERRIRSFNPIYRISNAALRFIHKCLCEGWCGHHEVAIPTLLRLNGFYISDFGGDGEFVAEKCRNKYYTSWGPDNTGVLNWGTMRYRPAFTEPGPLKNKIYHPVKIPSIIP